MSSIFTSRYFILLRFVLAAKFRSFFFIPPVLVASLPDELLLPELSSPPFSRVAHLSSSTLFSILSRSASVSGSFSQLNFSSFRDSRKSVEATSL